jgi:hypothetical protein
MQQTQIKQTPKKDYPKISLSEFIEEVNGWKPETKRESQKGRPRGSLNKTVRG